jgi:hypothetical protein
MLDCKGLGKSRALWFRFEDNTVHLVGIELLLVYLALYLAKHLLSIRPHVSLAVVGWRDCKQVESILQNILHLHIFRLRYFFDETKYLGQ